jgi:hypothetical protein
MKKKMKKLMMMKRMRKKTGMTSVGIESPQWLGNK